MLRIDLPVFLLQVAQQGIALLFRQEAQQVGSEEYPLSLGILDCNSQQVDTGINLTELLNRSIDN
jgi:hypothetical protein